MVPEVSGQVMLLPCQAFQHYSFVADVSQPGSDSHRDAECIRRYPVMQLLSMAKPVPIKSGCHKANIQINLTPAWKTESVL
jgi:hypothetical protein